MGGELQGNEILLLVNVGSTNTPDFREAGSQRDASIAETRAEIDIGSKQTPEKRAAGDYAATFTFESVYVPNNASFGMLKDAVRSGTTVLLRIQEVGVATEQVRALLTSVERNFAKGDAAVATVTGSLVERPRQVTT